MNSESILQKGWTRFKKYKVKKYKKPVKMQMWKVETLAIIGMFF